MPKNKNLKREDILLAVKTAANQNGGVLSARDFQRMTGISKRWIYELFPVGGYSEVLELAGIEKHPQHLTPVSDEALLSDFYRVACENGEFPTWRVFCASSQYSETSYEKRFGKRTNFYIRLKQWVSENHPESPLLTSIPEDAPRGPKRKSMKAESSELMVHDKQAGALLYGAPINFRGLQHAPINEQGVVFLFGMVCHELGFRVEAVQTGFPDCEAKLLVDRTKELWQRVRIEFEYKSLHFRDHGHDPELCDVIVCWKHNWADCPLKVVELSSVIKGLKSSLE